MSSQLQYPPPPHSALPEKAPASRVRGRSGEGGLEEGEELAGNSNFVGRICLQKRQALGENSKI